MIYPAFCHAQAWGDAAGHITTGFDCRWRAEDAAQMDTKCRRRPATSAIRTISLGHLATKLSDGQARFGHAVLVRKLVGSGSAGISATWLRL